MKKRIISLLCGLLATACSPDLHDENSVLENNRQQAEMSVEVQVSGTMISTRSAASAEERAVTSYDIYIFDVTTNALQYYKQGIVPAEPEKIAGTQNYRIGSEQIVLPTSGQKHVFVLGNAGGSVTLPTLVTLDEATESAPAIAPEAINAPNRSFACVAMTKKRQIRSRKSIRIKHAPNNPSSSQMMEKIISFWASGTKPSF